MNRAPRRLAAAAVVVLSAAAALAQPSQGIAPWRRTATAVARLTQTNAPTRTPTPTRTVGSPTAIPTATPTRTPTLGPSRTPTPTVLARPAIPTGLSANVSGSSVTLTWNPVSGADGYHVYRWTCVASACSFLLHATVGATTFAETLPVGSYYYDVDSYNASGNSAQSAWVTAIVYATTSTPTPASVLTATVTPSATATAPPTLTPTLGVPNAPSIALTPEADGSITVKIAVGEPPSVQGFKIERCDGGALADGTCPTGWHEVADIPVTPGQTALTLSSRSTSKSGSSFPKALTTIAVFVLLAAGGAVFLYRRGRGR